MAKKKQNNLRYGKTPTFGPISVKNFLYSKKKKKLFLQPVTTQPGQCPLNQVASGWETVDVRCLMASSHAYLVDM